MMRRKEISFFSSRRRRIFLWVYVQKTDWETTHLGHHVELRWRLKVFSSCGFEIHCIKVCLLILYSRIHGYMLSFMIEVDPYLLLPPCVLYEIQNQIFQQLCLCALRFCNQVLLDLHYWWSEEICSQQL